MSAALAKSSPLALTPHSLKEALEMSEELAKAVGFVPQGMANRAPAVLAAIMTGVELGIGPMEAMRSIHLIKGKPTLDASLMLKLAIRAGVKPQWLEHTTAIAKLRLTRDGFEPHTHEFTMEDAKRAGLATDTWRKYPAAMLRARCLSAAMRAYCPDVLGGAVYVEGELGEPEPTPPAAKLVPESEPQRHDNFTGAPMPEPDRVDDGEVVEEAAEPDPPASLKVCASENDLRRYCDRWGVQVIEAHGDKARSAIEKKAVELDVPVSVVSGWLPKAAA